MEEWNYFPKNSKCMCKNATFNIFAQWWLCPVFLENCSTCPQTSASRGIQLSESVPSSAPSTGCLVRLLDLEVILPLASGPPQAWSKSLISWKERSFLDCPVLQSRNMSMESFKSNRGGSRTQQVHWTWLLGGHWWPWLEQRSQIGVGWGMNESCANANHEWGLLS